MTTKDLANLIFPDIDKTIEDYKNMYPERNLKEGAKVTRFAPSPTGFMHIGNFQSALIDYVIAKNSEGVFYLRFEDTDQMREVKDAYSVIFNILNDYKMLPDEYEYDGKTVGNYGPYVQSKRKEIYHTFIKHLIEIGRAYPCFCSKEKLDEMRESQTSRKKRIGYYGVYATCRKLSVEEQIEKIKNNEPYVIRFKSNGNNEQKFKFDDLVRGTLLIPENDMDFIIMKSSDKLPTYHFAHFVDDYLMHTTHVVRGEEWLSSVPIHVELFNAFGVKPPKYIHTPLILKKDGENVRKISKRKDPEASMSYYKEKCYPIESVIESLMTIINSNYEQWHESNLEKTYLDFTFSPKKMSASGGALYDIEKLNNISKNFISKLSASEVYDRVLNWAKIYDNDFYELLSKYKEYSINVFNIEREQKKPRKDYENYFSVKKQVWYMYDELFGDSLEYNFDKINDKEEISKILKTYIEMYNESDDKDTWFNKVKELTEKLGYCSNMKEYKLNPDKYKGSVADISTVIRVAVTTLTMTPDLYEILRLLGKERIEKRFEMLY
ncbi:MAG: glutamate--tRNA ligase [Bacilli bacterium]|nr:glutamate--tRNA ligase [Bacilli bacterium]